jgi:hypothetical protein
VESKRRDGGGAPRGKKREYVSQVLPLDRWTMSPEYLRDLYGDDIADEYIRMRDEEMQLSDDELRAKIARDLGELIVVAAESDTEDGDDVVM